MDLTIQCVNIDSQEPARLADFWQAALGWRRTHETDDEIVLRLIGGIQRRVPKSTIAERKRMDTSLMPHGLERAMNEADLVNLVEYMSTLRRPR